MDHASDYNVDGGLLIQITPIFIIKEAWQGRSDGIKFSHSGQDDCCTIAIEPIISEGIVRVEVIFENTLGWNRIIGIADASCSFAAGRAPCGGLSHITDGISGNQRYADGQRVAVEVDMTTIPRRATFFVYDIEQPNFVIGIPEAIRFWVQRLIQSTAKGVKGSKALEWGKEWK
ncbi:MAG: hypothetical protein EZS28_013561 [Streblomastix strix]|uniref:Uncharacterized protein n=1 Tax=Streblomastix strix TaxID=222440 RepID=A0A5J4W7M7_9EUKA|nr:MAG: hypothetical protein EZS28_013561 [Streblomastix strix]